MAHGNAEFGGVQLTGGSTTIPVYYMALRLAGAQARMMLLAMAARMPDVPPASLTTGPHRVVHAASGRTLDYGEIAGAGQLPDQVAQATEADLKPVAAFRFIGRTEIARIDVPAKVGGSAAYGLDIDLPDMLHGVVLRSPVQGEIPEAGDRRAAVVPGVRCPMGSRHCREFEAVLRARPPLNGATMTGPGQGMALVLSHPVLSSLVLSCRAVRRRINDCAPGAEEPSRGFRSDDRQQHADGTAWTVPVLDGYPELRRGHRFPSQKGCRSMNIASVGADAPPAHHLALIIALMGCLLYAPAASAQDADGQRLFQQRCATCHGRASGENRVGPHLADLIGRSAGSVQGARYSPAMRQSDLTWTAETLEQFLASPRQVVPGTTMTVSLPNPNQRAQVIAYLESLSAGEGTME